MFKGHVYIYWRKGRAYKVITLVVFGFRVYKTERKLYRSEIHDVNVRSVNIFA